jgi:hypothetical protein
MAILSREAEALDLPGVVVVAGPRLGPPRHGPPVRDGGPEGRLLAFAEHLTGPGVFVMADAHQTLGDPIVLRQVKEFAQSATPGKTLVLTTPTGEVSTELEGLALPWTLKPPSREELTELVNRTADDLRARGLPVTLDADEIDALVEALRGVSTSEAEGMIQRAALTDGELAGEDVAFVRRAKAELLEAGSALELIEGGATLDAVGGLHP